MIIAICSNMDGPKEYHTKRSQTKVDIIWHHLNVESKKKWYKWIIYDIHTKLNHFAVNPKLTQHC